MSALRKIDYLTEEDYLQYELAARVKHEYLDGQIYAMAGASENHNLITGNLFFHLRNATRGKPCQVFSSEMKLRIQDSRAYYYPDVMLVCQRSPYDDDYYKHAPCLIAEVLSDSTQATDQREKLLNYQRLTSLHYYLMVDSRKKRVAYFVRNAQGEWQQAQLENGETLHIDCAACQADLTLASIYEDVAFN